MEFKEFSNNLGDMGIRLNRGPNEGWILVVPCRRKGTDNIYPKQIAAISKKGSSYLVVGLALPYFHGPRWREITGGSPMAVECDTLDDVLEYIFETFDDRWVDGALMIEPNPFS